MMNCPSDDSLLAAGFTETHGIALWTNPKFPTILIDTNAEIVSVFVYDTVDAVGSLEADPLSGDAEEAMLKKLGLPAVRYTNHYTKGNS